MTSPLYRKVFRFFTMLQSIPCLYSRKVIHDFSKAARHHKVSLPSNFVHSIRFLYNKKPSFVSCTHHIILCSLHSGLCPVVCLIHTETHTCQMLFSISTQHLPIKYCPSIPITFSSYKPYTLTKEVTLVGYSNHPYGTIPYGKVSYTHHITLCSLYSTSLSRSIGTIRYSLEWRP